MQCDVCEESPRDREWVCPSCVGVQVQRRRAAALMSAHDKGRVEAKYVAHVQREQARADRINEREQRRWRLVQLQREVQHEQIAVQRGLSVSTQTEREEGRRAGPLAAASLAQLVQMIGAALTLC